MLDIDEWGWTASPDSPQVFEAMMASLDSYLASKGAHIHQRPMTAKMLVGRLLGISVAFGVVESDSTIRDVGLWFDAMYARRLNPPFEARSFVLDLRGTLWRVRLGISFGSPVLFLDRDLSNDRSILRCLEGFTQPYADRLTQAELDEIMSAVGVGFPAIECLNGFSGHRLFDLALLDYEQSVGALESDIAWGKARWETAQAAEKIMKGMLVLKDPSIDLKSLGHIIPRIGKKVNEVFGVTLPARLLAALDCHPDVRYGDEDSTREEAVAAHIALLQLLPLLFETFYRASPKAIPRVKRS